MLTSGGALDERSIVVQLVLSCCMYRTAFLLGRSSLVSHRAAQPLVYPRHGKGCFQVDIYSILATKLQKAGGMH